MHCAPGVCGHVLGQVGQQDGHVEADGLAGLVVGLLESGVVDLALVVLLSAADQELNLLAKRRNHGKSGNKNRNSPCVVLCCRQSFLHLLAGDRSVTVLIHFLNICLLNLSCLVCTFLQSPM